MRLRRDSLAAAATAALEIREVGIRHDGVCTVGAMKADPGVITAIAGSTEMMLDLRHLDADTLATMLEENLEACRKAAEKFDCEVVAPARVRRHADAVPPASWSQLAREAVDDAGGGDGDPIPSRPAARRDGGRPARADRDDLRPVRPAALAHGDRGLARGGAARRDRGLRAHGRRRRSTRSPPASCRRRAHELDFGVVLQTDPPAAAGHRPRQARGGLRLLARVDVRLAPAVGGAVRHLLADPQRDAPARSSARWSPTRRRATGRSPRRCSRRSTRCTATARSAGSAAATRPCA